MMLSDPIVPRFALCAAGDTAAITTGGGGAVSTQDCVDAIRIDFIGLGVQVLINPVIQHLLVVDLEQLILESVVHVEKNNIQYSIYYNVCNIL
jgi:hypothetical protein